MAKPRFIFKNETQVVATFLDTKDGLSLHFSKTVGLPLFKYTEVEYAEAFFETGSLRIGTLFDFHRIETHGKFRGDDREGLMRYLSPEGDAREIASQNNWLFCMSRGLDEGLKAEFGGDGYRINDIRFFHEVTRALRVKLKALTAPPLLADVRYVDSTIPFEAGSEKKRYAGVRKDEVKFSYQNEARVMWETYPPLSPVFLRSTPETRREAMQGFIDSENARVSVVFIEAPAAIQYCTRL